MELITPGVGLLFWMSLTFFILLFILGKFGWPVIMKMIKDREAEIKKSLDAAEKARNDMQQLQLNNEQLLKIAVEEKDQILKQARVMGEKLIAESKEKAQQEAQRIVESARESINYEKLQAMTELKNQVASLSIDIAQKVIESELSNKEKDIEIISKRVSDFNLN